MRKILCSVRDGKSGMWSPPMAYTTRGEAVRDFSDQVNAASGESMLSRHADDYALFVVGEFDVTTGEVFASKQVESLGLGENFKRELRVS